MADEELIARFAEALEGASGELVRLADRDAVIDWARAEAACEPLLDGADFEPGQVADDPQIAVVSAELGIAETGSVVLVEPDPAARRPSLFARTLVVALAQHDLVPSLDEAFAWIGRRSAGGNYVTTVTGPSRTADIERSLTIGVQGPSRLVVALLP